VLPLLEDALERRDAPAYVRGVERTAACLRRLDEALLAIRERLAR
jgi:hypothetical protein